MKRISLILLLFVATLTHVMAQDDSKVTEEEGQRDHLHSIGSLLH
jgi:hypothetical protein